MFQKVAKTVAKLSNAKISASKLNLKVQNVYIKPLFKHQNAQNKPCFENVCLGENE
jgi:hypothetical protein